MAYVVQILVPTSGNDGAPCGGPFLKSLVNELAVTFGGVTTYLRGSATGLWEDKGEPSATMLLQSKSSWTGWIDAGGRHTAATSKPAVSNS
jgi:hypothetical protein